ncbi:hypothetical protein VTI74DRAFT_3922 [Chaetomium olivicolor]
MDLSRPRSGTVWNHGIRTPGANSRRSFGPCKAPRHIRSKPWPKISTAAVPARFAFELLQNADDNQFKRARETGALPSFAFEVHPRHIVVECNEDGFSKNDLEAICTVGKSTKSAKYGYIGAKGIGFKSVFIAAWKVYIQSGHFSFRFEHDKGDPGLGMVTPIWQDAAEELPSPLTRMTLYLHDKGDPSEFEHLRGIIFEQLSAIQPTCLLFLQNLKQIRVAFYGEDGQLEHARKFRRVMVITTVSF